MRYALTLVAVLTAGPALASPGCFTISDPSKRAICRAAAGQQASGCSQARSADERALCRALRDGRR